MSAKNRFLFFCLLSGISLSASAQNDPSATVGDTGTIDLMVAGTPPNPHYVTVRAADGNIWLQQNMGSSRVATSSTDTGGYGWLFQWGRWRDNHQFRNSTTSPVSSLSANNPDGLGAGSPNFYTGSNPNDWWGGGVATDAWAESDTASATKGIDPCAQLGSNWHMASAAEWANVLNMENITNAASAFSSNLKLTLAGQRDGGNGNLFNIGDFGTYWTSTTSGQYAKAVSIQSTTIIPADDALRSYGHSVRCLTTTCTGVSAPTSWNGPNVLCHDAAGTFNATPSPNASGYIWTLPAGWAITGPANTKDLTATPGPTAASGPAVITVRSYNNCDTSTYALTINVTVHPYPNVSITAVGTLMTATAGFTSYKWFRSGIPVSGATNQTHNATQDGSYTVEVTDANGCKKMSDPFNMTAISVGNVSMGPGAVKIYPNPSANILYIDTKEFVTVTITTPEGKLMVEKKNAASIDISAWSSGLYLIRIADKDGKIVRTEKLVKISQ